MSNYQPKETVEAFPLCLCEHESHYHETRVIDVFRDGKTGAWTGKCKYCTCRKYSFSGKAKVARMRGAELVSFQVEDWPQKKE